MKKIYTLMNAIILAPVLFINVQSQEMLVGGNMENEDDWLVTSLNQDDDNTVNWEFGYTATTPLYGKDGCLHLTGTNTGETGGMLTNMMFYQELTLQKGVEYVFSGAYMDNKTNNYWFEVWVGGNEPAEGDDYGADQGAVLVSGFKSTNWTPECPEMIDGLFEDACIENATNIVFYEGEGDTTVYFGFRMGIWDDGGNGYTFETWVDELSLMGPETSVNPKMQQNIRAFPNPVNSSLHLECNFSVSTIEIFDVTGTTSLKLQNVNRSTIELNTSQLRPGVYFVKVLDPNGKQFLKKILKK